MTMKIRLKLVTDLPAATEIMCSFTIQYC